MTTPKVVPCRISHIHALLGALRIEELREFALWRIKPRHGLLALWRITPQPWAAVDEKERVLAVWGDAAPALASQGSAWAFTSSAIEQFPLFFFREARRQLARMLESRDSLRCEIGMGCPKALRFYRLLGFEIGEPVDGFHPIHMTKEAAWVPKH